MTAYEREIKKSQTTIDHFPVKTTEKIRTWLEQQLPTDSKPFDTLLGFTWTGVVWGKVEEQKLHTAYKAEKEAKADQNSEPYSAEFLDDGLQELWLFGESVSLHLWKSDGKWQACRITDKDGSSHEYIEEQQILWGDQATAVGDSDFTLMADGQQGLNHVVPLKRDQIHTVKNKQGREGGYRPLRLTVRHYLDPDDPFARIAFSRLVKLESIPPKEADNEPIA